MSFNFVFSKPINFNLVFLMSSNVNLNVKIFKYMNILM